MDIFSFIVTKGKKCLWRPLLRQAFECSNLTEVRHAFLFFLFIFLLTILIDSLLALYSCFTSLCRRGMSSLLSNVFLVFIQLLFSSSLSLLFGSFLDCVLQSRERNHFKPLSHRRGLERASTLADTKASTFFFYFFPSYFHSWSIFLFEPLLVEFNGRI